MLQEFEKENESILKNHCKLFASFVLVFIDLDRDKGLAAVTYEQILKDVIRCSGMDLDIYTVGSFRHGRADTALAREMKARYMCDVGKWASREVFYKHYIFTYMFRDCVEQLLGQGST